MKLIVNAQFLRKGVSAMEVMFPLKQLGSALFVSVFCLFLAASGFSQGIATGSLSGTVTDPTGAIVLGASEPGDYDRNQ